MSVVITAHVFFILQHNGCILLSVISEKLTHANLHFWCFQINYTCNLERVEQYLCHVVSIALPVVPESFCELESKF